MTKFNSLADLQALLWFHLQPNGERWLAVDCLAEAAREMGVEVTTDDMTQALRKFIGHHDTIVTEHLGKPALCLGLNAVFIALLMTDAFVSYDFYKSILEFQTQDVKPERSK